MSPDIENAEELPEDTPLIGGPDGEPQDPAGGTSFGSGFDRSWQEMAFSTEPSKPLDTVTDPWNPDKGGTTRIMRGLEKAFSVTGLPAIADILIGIIEAIQNLDDTDDVAPGSGIPPEDSDLRRDKEP